MEERRAVERLKGGDVGGLEPLVRAHYARCVRAAYLVLRDREAAEDVVQGAFARIPEGIGSFDEARPFGPWFSKTVVNDAVKAASRRERTVSFYQGDAEELISRVADPSRGPHEAAEDSETRRRVWGALEQLPPAQRAVIVQRYYLGMTEAEMAGSASGLLDAIFQDKLPGGDAVDLGQKLDLTQTANGMRVTLERAYADQSSVVVGYTIEELEEDRQALGYPTRLEPSLEQEMVLTDGSGARLQNAEGPEWSGSDEDVPVVAVFEAGEGTEVGERERFRLEAPIGARLMVPPETTGPEASGPADDDLPYQVETGDPFVFDFEVPVRAAPTVQVDQKVEAGGVTLTLDRVIDSPARPEAVFCFEPPDDEREWYIRDLTGGSSIVPNEDNCRAYVLRSGLERRSTLTVTRIEGIPRPGTFRNDKEGNQKVRTIRGPWTFEFEVPER